MTRVVIDVPHVPYPGGSTTAAFFRKAARNLRVGYDVGGSNLRDTIALLLDRTAEALDGPDLSNAPDGRAVVEDLTYEERQALPAIYHQPVWYALATPAAWICEVCWDDGETVGWPCAAAAKDGRPIAEHAGLTAAL